MTVPSRLPASTHIGHVHLQVADLDRALGFTRDVAALLAEADA